MDDISKWYVNKGFLTHEAGILSVIEQMLSRAGMTYEQSELRRIVENRSKLSEAAKAAAEIHRTNGVSFTEAASAIRDILDQAPSTPTDADLAAENEKLREEIAALRKAVWTGPPKPLEVAPLIKPQATVHYELGDGRRLSATVESFEITAQQPNLWPERYERGIEPSSIEVRIHHREMDAVPYRPMRPDSVVEITQEDVAEDALVEGIADVARDMGLEIAQHREQEVIENVIGRDPVEFEGMLHCISCGMPFRPASHLTDRCNLCQAGAQK